MVNSRLLEDLLPRVEKKARQLIARCAEEDIELVVLSTYRDREAQEWLFASNRYRNGPVLTGTRPGFSFHEYRMAFDVLILQCGKPVTPNLRQQNIGKRLYGRLGEIGKELGLEWGGDFHVRKREPGHFHFSDGQTMQALRKAKKR